MQQIQTFGWRIREERKRLGLTQQQFADGLDISRSSVALYETDRTIPDLNFGLRAKNCGIDAWYIMTGERGSEAAANLFDWALFIKILSTIRTVYEDKKLVLATEQEIAIAQLLYGHLVRQGEMDDAMLNDAVLNSTRKLAA